MPISIDCPCGKRLLVNENLAAQKGQCPSCGRTLDISAATAPAEAPRALQAVEVPSPETSDHGPAPADRAGQRQQTTDGRWLPPAEMCDHGGSAIPEDADFFVPPPAAIGEVVSAYTSLTRDVQPTPSGTRAAWVGGAACAGALVGIVIAIVVQSPVPLVLFGLPLGCIGMALVLYATRFRYRCTYVGREGVARFRCSGSRGQLDLEEVFRFRDAAEVRVKQVRRFVNGVYQGTDYEYAWSDVAGLACYLISGTHKGRDNPPPPRDPYHYALAAELAWSNYMLGQVRARLMMSGPIFFGLGGGDWVRLGERKIILCLNGQTSDCDADDIEEVRIHQVLFQVRRNEGRPRVLVLLNGHLQIPLQRPRQRPALPVPDRPARRRAHFGMRRGPVTLPRISP